MSSSRKRIGSLGLALTGVFLVAAGPVSAQSCRSRCHGYRLTTINQTNCTLRVYVDGEYQGDVKPDCRMVMQGLKAGRHCMTARCCCGSLRREFCLSHHQPHWIENLSYPKPVRHYEHRPSETTKRRFSVKIYVGNWPRHGRRHGPHGPHRRPGPHRHGGWNRRCGSHRHGGYHSWSWGYRRVW